MLKYSLKALKEQTLTNLTAEELVEAHTILKQIVAVAKEKQKTIEKQIKQKQKQLT